MLATYCWTTNYPQTTCTYYLTLFAGRESGLGLAGCSAYRACPEAAVKVSAGAGGSASQLARVVLDGIRRLWAVGPRPLQLLAIWPLQHGSLLHQSVQAEKAIENQHLL